MLNIEIEGNAAQIQASQMLLPSHPYFASPINPFDYFSCTHWTIVDTRISEHARVLFTQQAYTGERVLMKILHDYKDTRYSQETPRKRQLCQLEALQRNRAFSPEVYIGLARIEQYNVPGKTICIGKILTCPTASEIEPGAEYALLMYQLPEDRNLIVLLKEQDRTVLQRHIHILTEHVADIHMRLLATSLDKDAKQWGTYEQLHEKLQHNFGLLDLVAKTGISGLDYAALRTTIVWLKKTLFGLFNQESYHSYFEQRIQEQRIRLCHGDLKVPHIWILPYGNEYNKKFSQYVKILDAIDFNPTYCNIDILSDFAMLAIDIQTRTDSGTLVTEMIEYYLKLTGQTDDRARAVLNYYLIEKAFVGAAISIVYDNAPELGLKLLNIAVKRLQSLSSQYSLFYAAVTQQAPYVSLVPDANVASSTQDTSNSEPKPHHYSATTAELLVTYSPIRE